MGGKIMINQVSLVGRLTRDPELRYTANGIGVCNFSIAVNRPFKNQSGENEADFLNVTVWRKQAEHVANYMKKGSLVGIEGSLRSRRYEKDGQQVYVVDVQADRVAFLEQKGKNTTQQQKPQNEASSPNDDPFKGAGESIDIDSDDLPF